VRSKTRKAGLVLALFALAATAELKLETSVIVSTAHAVVGRPLTPVSYAGVARRTSRRTVRRQDYYSPGVW
jgi:hypothetical protein